MKLVYCVPQLYRPGGIERIVTIKANSLVEDYNCEVIIITSDQKGLPTYYPLSERVKVYDLGIDYDSLLELPLHIRLLNKLKFSNIHKAKLSKLLNDIRADIVISTFTHESSFLPKIKDGSKKILESHFCRHYKKIMASAYNFPFMTKFVYYTKDWIEENFIIRHYDKFVVLTEEDKERWKSKIKNVICISNISPFDGESETAELVNKKAIAVGRLDAQKGFDRLISIWADVHIKNPDWILNIYGKGEDEVQLQNQIIELGLEGTVIINPPAKEIKQRYLESSIHLMTSNYEGIGLVLLEAATLGIPSVSFGFKCGARDVILNEKSGYIIENYSNKEFANKLSILMNSRDLRLEMGLEAKKQSSRYTKSLIMSKWLNIFNELVKK